MRINTNLKSNLQSISGDLQHSGLCQLTRNTNPGVGREHGATQLLTRDNHHVVGDHWETEGKERFYSELKSIKAGCSWSAGSGIKKTLTDGCEYIGETEVIHSIKGQEVVEELFLLIVTAQEGVALV